MSPFYSHLEKLFEGKPGRFYNQLLTQGRESSLNGMRVAQLPTDVLPTAGNFKKRHWEVVADEGRGKARGGQGGWRAGGVAGKNFLKK